MIGDTSKFNALTKIFNDLIKYNYFSFESLPAPNIKYESRKNYFQSSKIPFGNIKNMTYELCDFNIQNLVIENRYTKINEDKRCIKFFIHGSANIWNYFSQYNSIKINGTERKPTQLIFNGNLPFSITIDKDSFKESDTSNKSISYEYKVLTIEVSTNEDYHNYSDIKFKDQAIEIIDEILLLTSFIETKKIDWYRYIYQNSKSLIRCIKSVETINKDELDMSRFVLEPTCHLRFLQTALPKLRYLKSQNFDLKIPILYYIHGVNMPFIEAEFTTVFTALEYIKSMFAQKSALINIIKPSHFKKFKKNELKELIFTKFDFPINIDIYEKALELNRYSILKIIEELCKDLKINIKDFFPGKDKITFIKTRNTLIHDASVFDMDFLFDEYSGLKALVETIILKYLDWEYTEIILERNFIIEAK
jgi:hypothetical protein